MGNPIHFQTQTPRGDEECSFCRGKPVIRAIVAQTLDPLFPSLNRKWPMRFCFCANCDLELRQELNK